MRSKHIANVETFLHEVLLRIFLIDAVANSNAATQLLLTDWWSGCCLDEAKQRHVHRSVDDQTKNAALGNPARQPDRENFLRRHYDRY